MAYDLPIVLTDKDAEDGLKKVKKLLEKEGVIL